MLTMFSQEVRRLNERNFPQTRNYLCNPVVGLTSKYFEISGDSDTIFIG